MGREEAGWDVCIRQSLQEDGAQPKQAIIRRNDHVEGLVLAGVGVRNDRIG